MTLNTFRYSAFISYSRKDEHFAKWLHKKLEKYSPPRKIRKQCYIEVKKPFYPIFLDEEELSVSTSLSDEIEYALKNAKFLIVLCSPNSASSRWVNEEIRRFKLLGREKYIIPIIIAG